MKTIPIIDFTNLSTRNGRVPSRENWTSVAAELDKVLSTVGFAYIINHDVDQRKISRAFETSKNFFEQPQEAKQKYLKNAKTYHGYLSPGKELLHPNSSHEVRESYDFVSDPRSFVKCDFIDFDSANLDLKSECKPLTKKILRALAISLEMEDEEFFINSSQHLDNPSDHASFSDLRSLYYPAIGDDVEVNTVRCAEHSDYGIVSILFQDDIGGLEVRTVDNKWISATPIPGSILINTGDLLEFWSNGYFPATKHRVLIPETELRRKVPRQSIAYFHHADDSAIVTPLDIRKSPNIDNKIYGIINAGDHAKKRLDTSYTRAFKLAGKNCKNRYTIDFTIGKWIFTLLCAFARSRYILFDRFHAVLPIQNPLKKQLKFDST